MAFLASLAYGNVFRRTSTFLVTAVVAAFFFERGVDVLTTKIFDGNNKGKQWKDIKHLYEGGSE